MAVTLTQDMLNGAKETQTKYGIPASITLGQIMLESSGSNAGGLSKLASDYNNLFGIKANPNNQYQSDTVVMSNKAGKDTGTYAVFETQSDSILEHARILNLDRYTSKVTTGTYQDWAKALQSGGYATDSKYSEKLISVIEENNLSQYDTGETATIQYNTNEDNLNIFGDIAVIVFVVLLLVIGVFLFVGAFTGSNPVTEATKTVKNISKLSKKKGGNS